MNPTNHITLADVALAAGVSRGAASLALRGKAGVSAKTKAKVEEAAERLGYSPDAVASLLAMRRGKDASNAKIGIGYLGDLHSDDAALLAESCRRMGVILELFRPSEFASPEAASRILWQRGISGLLVQEHTLWPDGEWERFDWSRFSLVKLSRGKRSLPCNLIRHSAFDYMAMALHETQKRGYRKLAVLLHPTIAEQDDEARLGAVLAFEALRTPADGFCRWKRTGIDRFDEEVITWLRETKPDAIVAFHWAMIYPLLAAGYSFPGPIGLTAVLAAPAPIPNTPWVSGCDPGFQQRWDKALTVLLEQIGRGERGFSDCPGEFVIEPAWIEGETLPQR